MKLTERHKIQKNIDTIQSGNFNETNVESLFTNLRPYCKGYNSFREIADFVAHNDERNKGLVNKTLENRYLILAYFLHYVSPKKKLNINNEFPSWIIKLVEYQSHLIDKKEFLDNFKFSRSTFLKNIKEGFPIDYNRKVAIPSKKVFSENFYKALSKCLTFIHNIPPLTQDQVIKEIIGVLKTNKITIKENLIRQNSNKIIISVLILLHKTKYTFEELSNAETLISNEKSTQNSEDILGNLYIAGKSKVKDVDGVEIEILTHIFSTNLKVEEWCDSSLITTVVLDDNTEVKYVDLDEDITLDNNFRISKPNF